MQRFGHEGYPVVDNGKVVGLLTRRAVDRAQSHKLPTTISSLMEVGDYTVNPDDSIEHVQRLVTDTGWGQIPVVDPKTEEIIGIVTRTDLLQNLTPGPKSPGHLNLSSRLESVMPPDRLGLLKIIAEAAHEQRAALYIVGGFVRDLLLETPSPDFDLVVEGDAIILARGLALQYGGRVTGHSRFGTAKPLTWFLPEPSFIHIQLPCRPWNGGALSLIFTVATSPLILWRSGLMDIIMGSSMIIGVD
jgi:tRNA nucleotidyltransferase (CCA-adding enzyme)